MKAAQDCRGSSSASHPSHDATDVNVVHLSDAVVAPADMTGSTNAGQHSSFESSGRFSRSGCADGNIIATVSSGWVQDEKVLACPAAEIESSPAPPAERPVFSSVVSLASLAEAASSRSRPSFFTIRLPIGILVVVAIVVAGSGFPHLAVMHKYNANPMESRGVETYRTALAGEGTAVLQRFYNNLAMFVSMGFLMYVTNFERQPYGVLEPPSSASWDLGLHKWFLSESAMHPERRFYYVDFGSGSWTGQTLSTPAPERVVGSMFSPYGGFTYTRNLTPSALPLRYGSNADGYVPHIYSPMDVATDFLMLQKNVSLINPFIDFEGNFSFGFAMVLFDTNQMRLQGVFMVLVPLEYYIEPPHYTDVIATCDTGICSATFSLGVRSPGLLGTTVPAVASIYVPTGTANAACSTHNSIYTRCRHSVLTVSEIWPQLGTVLRERPDVLSGDWLSFPFDHNGEKFLSTSAIISVDEDVVLTIVIAPADNIVGTFYRTRQLIINIVVGSCSGSWLLALVVSFLVIRRITVALDDMTSALALRHRKDDKSEFELRRANRQYAMCVIEGSEAQDLDVAIRSLYNYLETIAALLPPVVISSLRSSVATRQQALRRDSKWWYRCWSCLRQQRVHHGDAIDTSEIDDDEEDSLSPNHSFGSGEQAMEQDLIHAMRVASVGGQARDVQTNIPHASHRSQPGFGTHRQQRELPGDDCDVIVLHETSVAPQEADYAFVVNDSITSQLLGTLSDPEDVVVPPCRQSEGILLSESRMNAKAARRRGVFSSVALRKASFSSLKVFDKFLCDFMEATWFHNGDVEVVRADRLVCSFGCYGDSNPDGQDFEASACTAALQTLKLFATYISRGEASGSINVALDAGRFEDGTFTYQTSSGAPARYRIVKTSAFYSAQVLNGLSEVYGEPLIVTHEVRKNLKKVASTALDCIRFSPTRLPRLSRMGAVLIYKLELRSTSTPLNVLRIIKIVLSDALTLMCRGEYARALEMLQSSEGVMRYSQTAQRFATSCESMIRDGKGVKSAAAARSYAQRRRQLHYYRGEVLDWEVHAAEAAIYQARLADAGAATERQHFGEHIVLE